MSWKRGLWSPHKLVAKCLMMFDDEEGDEDEIEDDEVHIFIVTPTTSPDFYLADGGIILVYLIH